MRARIRAAFSYARAILALTLDEDLLTFNRVFIANFPIELATALANFQKDSFLAEVKVLDADIG